MFSIMWGFQKNVLQQQKLKKSVFLGEFPPWTMNHMNFVLLALYH